MPHLSMVSARISFTGVVQGVGFRPFLFRLARRLQVTGYVRNIGDAGVEAVIEGTEANIAHFVKSLRNEAPPICEITNLHFSKLPYRGQFEKFTISESKPVRLSAGSVLPPDIAVCDSCIVDILDSRSKWHDYPFTCCANCGPRFAAVSALPYDRQQTNMGAFPLCEECLAEYLNPENRRFHAQGICCPVCGPSVVLYDRDGKRVDARRPIAEAGRIIDEGATLAVKGIGGVHLSCATTDDAPLSRLRETKRKFFQPFAVMAADLSTVSRFADVSQLEREWLSSWRRPIVTLRKGKRYFLSDLVAPGLDTIGVMLPYTGLHLLLTRSSSEPAIVMTSGNITGLPMSITNDDAFGQLRNIVDYFLLHNREIVARCDDSVVRVVGDGPVFIRRSRGWVPGSLEIPLVSNGPIVGVGAELRLVGGLLSETRCHLTQHIGDGGNLETVEFLQAALRHMASLTGTDLRGALVARDMHPRYLTSRFALEFAKELEGKVVSIQHHHAHVAALMAENNLAREEEVVGVAVDGIGYGIDGDLWGGEVLVCSYDRFERVGHLARQPMPGGDLCARYPLRMCAAMLREYLDERSIREQLLSKSGPGNLSERDLSQLETQIDEDVGVAWTSSIGRVFDAFAAVAGICLVRTYEGEPAMRLEAAALDRSEGHDHVITPTVKHGNIVDTSTFLRELIMSLNHLPKSEACRMYQAGLAVALGQVAAVEAKRRGIEKVGLTGGAAINTIFVESFARVVKESGLKLIQHRLVPCGDGGIALGQLSVAAARM